MFIAGISLGVSALCLSLLFGNKRHGPQSLFHVLIVVLFGWLASGPWWLAHNDGLTQIFVSSLPFVFYLLVTCAYWFQMALIHQSTQTVKHYQSWLVAPSLVALLLTLSMLFIPRDEFIGVFIQGQEPSQSLTTVTTLWFGVMVLIWLGLSALLFIQMVRNGVQFQGRLNELLSDHTNKRLNWFTVVLAFWGITWLYSIAVLALEDKFQSFGVSEAGVNILLLASIWIFSVYSLRHQTPNIDIADSSNGDEEEAEQYERSAIDDDRMASIAEKIHRVIVTEHGGLDPDINAVKLAEQIGISTHYLSQTFSQHLSTTFYDYVNNARIDSAKSALLHTDKTVIDIAYDAGFNTRSSFYNAFKKQTGMTPSAFRKQG